MPAPSEHDDEELIVDAAQDEEGFHRLIDKLLGAFEQHARATHPPDGVVWQHGDFVASSMLPWKGGYADGRLGRWTQADLAELHAETIDEVVALMQGLEQTLPASDGVRWFTLADPPS